MSTALGTVISRIAKAEKRLTRLEAVPQRRLLTDYPWLRGWKDDFLGDQFCDQYDVSDKVGAGSSIYLIDGIHGGMTNIYSGNVANNYQSLWLGAAGGTNDTISADPGFLMIGNYAHFPLTNLRTRFGTCNAAGNRRILLQADTSVSGNFILVTQDAGGTTTVDSGVPLNAAWNWWALEAEPTVVNLWLEGVIIATSTTHIPTDVLTPTVRCQSLDANAHWVTLDYWAVIPN
jgi:hypothetical protein